MKAPQRQKRSRGAAADPVDWVAVLAEQEQKAEVFINSSSLGWLLEILPTPDADGHDCVVLWAEWKKCSRQLLAQLSRR